MPGWLQHVQHRGPFLPADRPLIRGDFRGDHAEFGGPASNQPRGGHPRRRDLIIELTPSQLRMADLKVGREI